jgi:kynureninase
MSDEAKARALDSKDKLKDFRSRFFIPQHHGKDAVYLTGNSLGLQPKTVKAALEQELDDWANLGVEGHFNGANPWFYYHKFLNEASAKIVGALPDEVVLMNQLTVNLHLMMVSFYRPIKERYKIIMEAGAFPSDQYAVESQVKFHGFDYKKSVIEIAPRAGEYALRTEDIIAAIEEHGSSLALVMFSGVQYYTGQVFDVKALTDAAHKVGAIAGFDLAHAAGNVRLNLHNWDVDFAVWCSYKYLNSGPGGVSGAFIHQRHINNPAIPRFAGWWGHDEEVRFRMEKGFIPQSGAAGWQLSNAPVFSMAVHKASLNIFDEAGMDSLTAKSKTLTVFLETTLKTSAERNPKLHFNIITPKDRGCQLSVLTGSEGKKLHVYLAENGVIADWREPNVIRMAPVPLYNSFEDIDRLGRILEKY